MMRLDSVNIKNAGLTTEGGRWDAFGMMRYVMTIMVPFDFQRTIALRYETSNESAVAGV